MQDLELYIVTKKVAEILARRLKIVRLIHALMYSKYLLHTGSGLSSSNARDALPAGAYTLTAPAPSMLEELPSLCLLSLASVTGPGIFSGSVCLSALSSPRTVVPFPGW